MNQNERVKECGELWLHEKVEGPLPPSNMEFPVGTQLPFSSEVPPPGWDLVRKITDEEVQAMLGRS